MLCTRMTPFSPSMKGIEGSGPAVGRANPMAQNSIMKMKPGVRIINCARGEVVNLEDLHQALDSGHVAGAALSGHDDVQKVSFTGSTAVGKKIVESALGNLKVEGKPWAPLASFRTDDSEL